MKSKRLRQVLRGAVATTASLLTVTALGYSVAKSPLAVGWMDGWFGADRTIYRDWTEDVPGYTIPGKFEGYSYLKGKAYTKSDATVQEYAKRLRNHVVKQGEEGFALLKNDNEALPLKKSTVGKKVALFGWNAYNCPKAHTGVIAGNITGDVKDRRGNIVHKNAYYNQVTLYDALKGMDGVEVNDTVTADQFTGAMTGPSNGGGFGGKQNAWDTISYKIPEIAPTDEQVATWNIDKANTTAIVALGRGGGEGNNYKVDSATNQDGTKASDPLALSKDELKIVKLAKEKCSKVVVLIVSSNAMELGPLVEKGGEYEVDAIGFCGIPNDWQYEGIAHVLYGSVNASGGLTDTYVYDNTYTPASINMGEQHYSDLDTITSFTDPLGRGITEVGNKGYYADHYIVETEGIYVGYKYYETRYYDSMVNPSATNATSTKGSSKTGSAWNYANEVVFPFGQSLSYIPYTQTIKDVSVNVSESGKIKATITVKNNGTEDGNLLAQLYVGKPYTDYDKTHKVEKSAVDFLNSKKVFVKAGESKDVEISLPTHYLASWDSSAVNNKGAYILDEGDYYFTAAAGAHEAVNNVLAKQGHETDKKTTTSACATWTLDAFNNTAFAKSNGFDVKNEMKNSDINYYLGDNKVTYLSRSDWDGTFPKNYTSYTNDSGIQSEPAFTIKGSPKETEWLTELISAQYKITPSDKESDWAKLEGENPSTLKDGQTVYQWILQLANDNPEAFSNIHSDQWQQVAKAFNLGEAVASVYESGGSSRKFTTINNPTSRQSESVAGYSQTITVETDAGGNKKTLALNVASNSLLGSSFNPELAHEWGVIEGEGGLWIQALNDNAPAYTVWGMGLTQHRHAYNGRNSEYISEDPMLANRIGEQQMVGAVSKGAICGPKHMGFNDQERGREGNACYMTEQKVRETDTRCFEGALRYDEGNGTGVMMSFARIGATNCTNSVGYVKNILRGEFGFTGIISTDMGKGKGYHEVGALTMATVNEYAGFGSGDTYAMGDNVSDDATFNKSFDYITLGNCRKDPTYAAQARQTALYIVFTLARSGSGLYVERIANNGQDIVVPPSKVDHHDPVGTVAVVGWEKVFIGFEIAFGVLTAAAVAGYVVCLVLAHKKENN